MPKVPGHPNARRTHGQRMKPGVETVKLSVIRGRIRTMSTQTITEFLEARIAEDEALAQDCVDSGPWYPWRSEQNLEWWVRSENFGHVVTTGYVGNNDARPNAEYIARNDPARVLAECAAKRAIIEQHKDWPVLVEKKPEFSEDTSDIHGMTYWVTQEMVWLTEREYVKRFGVEAPTTNMILALAAVYKDHPDYRQDWAL